jgi:hypothetical protein
VPDAARHLSIVFGEEVTEADVLRLALDGRLRLSVYFVNGAYAKCGKVVSWEETEWFLAPPLIKTPIESRVQEKEPNSVLECPLKLKALWDKIPMADRAEYFPFMRSLHIDDNRFLNLNDEMTTLEGVWDLTMIGTERLDVEHEYQWLTGGPAVTLVGLDGALVEKPDRQHCQIQESFDDNEYSPGSNAEMKKLKQHIADNNIGEKEAGALLSRHKEKRKDFLTKRDSKPKEHNYYPGSLPNDSVLVVRTCALAEFEQSINVAPTLTDRAHASNKLALLNKAATKFWANADRDERSTHTDNATIVAWLIERGYSPSLAEKAATIIRPDWAPTGRKPEE